MFTFKKFFGPLFYPVPLCLEILGLGLLLLWFTRRQRLGKLTVTLGVSLLAFFSLPLGPLLLVQPLECRYQPLRQAPADPSIKWVVVLSGGIYYDPLIPVSSCLTDATLFRIMEGVRLHKQLPGSKLLLSGGAIFNPRAGLQVMPAIARIMGVDDRDLVLETASRDTEKQATLIRDLVRRDKFILVTSAMHMPRSLALFRKQGLNPIPAPTNYLLHRDYGEDLNPESVFPSARNLQGVEDAIHEYLGLAWAWLRGNI